MTGNHPFVTLAALRIAYDLHPAAFMVQKSCNGPRSLGLSKHDDTSIVVKARAFSAHCPSLMGEEELWHP